MRNNREIGVRGEMQATQYLEKLGYEILDKNVLYHGGEIDIVASIGETIVFVEVKNRENVKYGNPVEALTPAKIKAITKCANLYIVRKNWLDRNVRFDVIAILRDNIEHIQDAFWMN